MNNSQGGRGHNHPVLNSLNQQLGLSFCPDHGSILRFLMEYNQIYIEITLYQKPCFTCTWHFKITFYESLTQLNFFFLESHMSQNSYNIFIKSYCIVLEVVQLKKQDPLFFFEDRKGGHHFVITFCCSETTSLQTKQKQK